MSRFLLCTANACLLLALSGPQAVEAQPPPPPPPIELKLTPQKAPTPRLRFPLLSDFRELSKGNAAICYHRAMLLRGEFNNQQGRKDYEESLKLEELLKQKVSEVPAKPFEDYLKPYALVFKELDAAARRDHCDWDLEQRLDEDGISTLLPEVQKMREFARLLKFRARMHMIQGKLDEALKDIRTGFAMARNVGEGSTLIQSLVGIAIFHIFVGELEILLEQPGAPNLYWSLTALPRPFISLKKGLEGEARSAEGTLPMWREVEKGILTPEQARKSVDAFAKLGAGLFDMESKPGPGGSDLMISGYIALQYPTAKRSLIAMGRSESDVEAMPAAQVVILDGKMRFRSLQDEMFVWAAMPPAEAIQGMKNAETKLKKLMAEDNGMDIFGVRLMGALLPAIEKVYNAYLRTERRIAMLRVVEAIRLHAAETGDGLPKKLADIKMVPIPVDPQSGKPFEYSVDGKVAMLVAPPTDGSPPHHGNSIRYLISLEK